MDQILTELFRLLQKRGVISELEFSWIESHTTLLTPSHELAEIIRRVSDGEFKKEE